MLGIKKFLYILLWIIRSYRINIYTSAKHINKINYIGVICIGKEYSKKLNTL